ncbi:MAG: M55 family metallopeptidase [Alphaproteobacteria bacterium]|nr:M55 family metallopeptidase [Alphaproteobacteria bacterium]
MKVYISVDIEGIAGITHWDEAEKNHADWQEFREIMTREANAAIVGAISAGATDIYVKDAHDSGRNLITTMLPRGCTIIREWSGHPYSMIQELDESFDALVMIGWHAHMGSEENALAHTMNTRTHMVKLNGKPASEFTLFVNAAATLGVPTVFVSGDEALMREVESTNPNIARLAVKRGVGASTISMSPRTAQNEIRTGVNLALRAKKDKCLVTVPEHNVLEITYASPTLAYEKSFYPGVKYVGDRTNRIETTNFFDVMRALRFIK